MTEEIKIDDQVKAKTSEEIMEEKKKLFAEDPSRFVDAADLILAVAKHEGQYMVYVRPNANSLDMMYAKGQLCYTADQHMRMLEFMASKEKKIVQPKGSMHAFANKIMGKGK